MAELRTPQGHTLLLPDGAVSIGADPGNQVPVAAHLGLAPVHFRLQPWEGGHFIEDAGSGLGTLVNGHAINWKPLAHGDVIIAGELEVIYSLHSHPEVSSAPVVAAPPPHATLALQAPLLNPQPTLVPLLPEIAAAPSFSLRGPSLHDTLPRPFTPAQPPSWLPEDLLPEAYREPAVTDKRPSAGESAAPSGDFPDHPRLPSEPVAATRHRFRRLLPLAAILATLGWAGHAAWSKTASQAPEAVPAPETAPSPGWTPLPSGPVPSPPATEVRR